MQADGIRTDGPAVTVAIPARNAARTLGGCLRAVRAMDPGPVEILVLDDRSTDETARIARDHGATVLTVPGSGGLGVSRNLALNSCRTPRLAFLNADCYPEPDWLARLGAALDAAGAAVAGGRQTELRRGTLAERWKAEHLRQDAGDAPLDDPDFLSGGNLLIDLGRLGEVRFEPCYDVAYEDVDFCRRARAEGRRLVYQPAASVGHDHAETLRTLPRKVWSYGVQSKAVGEVDGLAGALGAFARLHRRPNDQTRLAFLDDARARRADLLCVDLYLFSSSLFFFLAHAASPSRFPGPVRRGEARPDR